jgi:hypothetical protein
MTGDVERTAGLTAFERDDGVVHFGRWRPFDQNALSRSAIVAPASEEGLTSRVVARRHDRAIRRWR